MKLKDMIPKPITASQYEAYGRIINNMTYLSVYLADKKVTKEDVCILIKIELENKRRDYVFSRLLGKLTTFYRRELREELDELLKSR